MPASPSTGASLRGRRAIQGKASATAPPTANSHARVVVSKYAIAGSAGVWTIEYASDAAPSAPSITASRNRSGTAMGLLTSAAAISRSGQTR